MNSSALNRTKPPNWLAILFSARSGGGFRKISSGEKRRSDTAEMDIPEMRIVRRVLAEERLDPAVALAVLLRT